MIRQIFLVVTLLTFGSVVAQTLELPTLVDTNEALELTGRGFETSQSYTLSLTAPDGERQEIRLEPDASGSLRYSTELSASGIWTLRLTGNDFEQSQRIVAYSGAAQEESSATEGIDPDAAAESSSTSEAPADDTASSEEAAESPGLTPLPLLSDEETVNLSEDAAQTEDANLQENTQAPQEATTDTTEAVQDETAEAAPIETDESLEEQLANETLESVNAVTEDTAQPPDSDSLEAEADEANAELSTQEDRPGDEPQERDEVETEDASAREDVNAEEASSDSEDQTDAVEETKALDTSETEDEAVEGDTGAALQPEIEDASTENTSDVPSENTQAETDEAAPGDEADAVDADASAEESVPGDEGEAASSDDADALADEPEDAAAEDATGVATEADQTETDEAVETSQETSEDTEEAVAVSSDPDVPQNAVIENNTVVYDGGGASWELGFPAGSGPLGAVLEREGAVYLGHGNSLLALDPATGDTRRRWVLGAPVTGLEPKGEDLLVSSTFSNGLIERYTLSQDEIQEEVRFDTDPELFGWLRAEAEVEDPNASLTRDPTNPWLYFAAGQAETNPEAARELYTQAIERAETFYDLAGLSRALYDADEEGLARRAFDTALSDFAARGYSPSLLTDLDLHEAYNFPLEPFREAIRSQDLGTAGFWAEWMQYLTTASVPETRAALLDYAALLRDQGQRDEAAQWRERAQQERQATLTSSLDRLFRGIGRVGWYASLAVFVGILMLYLTLIFKYWVPQTVMLNRQRDSGKTPGPLARLWAVRYFSTTEKLVIVFMYAVILALIGLAIWANRTDALPLAARSGTLASAPARDFVMTGPISGSRAAFLQGYAAQTANEGSEAEAAYARAEDYAPAVNNMGALLNSEALYVRALELSPGLGAAQYNLGRETRGFPFEREYRVGEPVLVIPEPLDMQIALGGSWQKSFVDTFSNPWAGLRGGAPPGLAPWLWTVFHVLLLVLIAISVVWLFFPRPRLARNAPRSFLYQILALLIPGTGLADELWGALLLIPWAIFGLDALSNLFSWGFGLGLGLQRDIIILSILYLINLVAFIVEFISYRRRMRELKKNNPAQARAFGMVK